jgi:hypothetical protein
VVSDVDLFAGEVRQRAAAEGRAPTAHAVDGLASDYWWRDCRMETQRKSREWVRLRLLQNPHMTDHDCDRFVASLSPGKREDLIRRAVNGHGPKDF